MSLADLPSFVQYLWDAQNEDELFQVWLHKGQGSYDNFKGKYFRSVKPKKKQNEWLSEAREQEIIDYNAQFIKPRNVKGGEADG